MEISLFSASSAGPTIDKENASKASELLWFYLEKGKERQIERERDRERAGEIYTERK